MMKQKRRLLVHTRICPFTLLDSKLAIFLESRLRSIYCAIDSSLYFKNTWVIEGRYPNSTSPNLISLIVFSLKGKERNCSTNGKEICAKKSCSLTLSIPVYQNTCQYPCGKLVDKGRKNLFFQRKKRLETVSVMPEPFLYFPLIALLIAPLPPRAHIS